MVKVYLNRMYNVIQHRKETDNTIANLITLTLIHEGVTLQGYFFKFEHSLADLSGTGMKWSDNASLSYSLTYLCIIFLHVYRGVCY